MAKGKIVKAINSEQLSIQPVIDKLIKKVDMPPLALFASKNLKVQQVLHLGEKRNTLE